MEEVKKQYDRRIEKYKYLLKKQNETLNFYSALRLIAFVTGLSFTFYLYRIGSLFTYFILPVFSTVFILFVIKHRNTKGKRDYTLALIHINEISIKRTMGEWKNFKDTGSDFVDTAHRYSCDLDIFGKASLFQRINMSVTTIGRISLKKLLTETPADINTIIMRQQGIKELATKIKWRQRLFAEALVTLKNDSEYEAIYSWANERPIVTLKGAEVLAKLLPLITVLLLLAVFSKIISKNAVYILIIFQMGIVFISSKKLNNVLGRAYNFKNSINIYEKIIRHIEKQDFKSKLLVDLKANLKQGDLNASDKIKELGKIVNLISDRHNMLYIVINILFLWDINCVIALEKWKSESGVLIKRWINTIGEFEAYSSLANLCFDNKEWIFPVLTEEFPLLKAKGAAHPLITENNISNDIIINKASPAMLITGSNMSGKSTYLRNAGLNLVLAYSGGTVNAKEFKCSLMNIYTCMRISDNLEKNISSFYAEIIRIKEIVAASSENKNVFFLLDEIFKGTNSIDRHLGAKILINSLIDKNTAGMVSTHDLELGELQDETKDKVKNYHFEEFYKDGELKFDYKLKSGISKTRNAMYLIKMAGIEMEDTNENQNKVF
ncbi:MAG: MutS-related protein [Solirubrobacterales bacterium]